MQVDTIFSNAKVYNVFLKKWSITDLAVLSGKILYIGDVNNVDLSAKKNIDCERKPLIPGLIDIHLHIESSLCTPNTFASTVLPHGITTVVSEPHEIANVFGLPGIEEMIRVSEGTVMDIFYGTPSSVPSTNKNIETTGGEIDVKELEVLFTTNPEVICLGEVMNYSDLINNFEQIVSGEMGSKTLRLINYVKKQHPLSVIEGHCPSVRDLDLAKLLYLGIDSDHCLQDLEGMSQRLENGMFVEIQEKSITPEIIDYLQNNDFEGLYCFVTDDVPPDILQDKGHLDYVVRKALKIGLSLEKVIIATSLAPARRMGFQDRGAITPGKIADFILLKDSSSRFIIEAVYKRGILSTSKSDIKPTPEFNVSFHNSLAIKLSDLSDSMYKIYVDQNLKDNSTINCRVIRKNNKDTYTESIVRPFTITEKTVKWFSPEANVNLVIVIDRYTGKANFTQGLLDGSLLHNGAFCSSYAHDHHNILLLGDNINDMKKALEWVITQKGGMCTISHGQRLASVELPIGGIISEAPIDQLAQDVKSIQQALRSLGIDHPNPIMSICTLSLPVSPELKITDKGLIDVKTSSVVPLFVN